MTYSENSDTFKKAKEKADAQAAGMVGPNGTYTMQNWTYNESDGLFHFTYEISNGSTWDVYITASGD